MMAINSVIVSWRVYVQSAAMLNMSAAITSPSLRVYRHHEPAFALDRGKAVNWSAIDVYTFSRSEARMT